MQGRVIKIISSFSTHGLFVAFTGKVIGIEYYGKIAVSLKSLLGE